MAHVNFRALAIRAVVAFVAVGVVAAVVLSMTLSKGPVPMHVRWKPGTTGSERASLEARYHLTQGQSIGGTTWAYLLADSSTDNIRAMVQDPKVEDTEDINRIRFRPRFSNDRSRRLPFFSVLAGVLAAAVVIGRTLTA